MYHCSHIRKSGQTTGFAHREADRTRLRFTPERARWVSGERWYPEQKSRRDGDHYILEIPYSDDRELVLEILKHGAHVEVLHPKPLRDKVLAQLLRAASQYKNEGSSIGG